MTNKWQCSKCKKLLIEDIVDLKAEKEKVKCCFRLMRNLSEAVYLKEKSIDDSGIRSS